ncbi:hypothetical protein BO70DRAFT_254620, partial [Aspergillus heteromorphus CBS 117.55]
QTTPSTVQFLDHLISRLDTASHGHLSGGYQLPAERRLPFPALNPSQIPEVKSLMLTLHCIFPNELLLALDILDRNLVKRFVRGDNPPGHPADAHVTTPPTTEDVFLVLSASTNSGITTPSAPSKPRPSELDQKGYEVRLLAWNCTCPTFTLAGFRNLLGPEVDENEGSSLLRPDLNEPPRRPVALQSHYSFGGTLTRGLTKSSPPAVCKHLLACLLKVRCPGLFGHRENDAVSVSAAELAGWCAGWGG